MNLVFYDHLLAEESIDDSILSPLIKSLEETTFKLKKGCAKDLRKKIERLNQLQGWSGPVKIDKFAKISITSMKGNTGLCVQTGNMSRFYADMIKLQNLYVTGKIKSGIYIIPTKEVAKVMGDNLANFERFILELNLFKQIITVPIHVIGIEK